MIKDLVGAFLKLANCFNLRKRLVESGKSKLIQVDC